MKTKVYNKQELFKTNYKSIKGLRNAEKLAWFFFGIVGVGYIAITLIIQLA